MLRKALILNFIFVTSILSQIVTNSEDSLQVQFNKRNITWNWQDLFDYDFVNHDFGIDVYQKFSSTLIKPSSNIKNWRDENNFKGFFFKKFSNFDLGFYTYSWNFSDRQSERKSNFSNHSLGIKTKYLPDPKLRITPYVGYQRDQNKMNIDWGWDIGLNGSYDNFQLDNYKSSIDGHLDYDFYPGRQNTNQGIALKFETQFSPVTVDSISLVFDHSNKQYYAPNSDKIINVKYEEKLLNNYFDYRLSRTSNFKLQTILSSKYIYDNSRAISERDVLKFENRMDLFSLFNKLILNLGFDTFQEKQNNTDINTDSDALQSNIRTNMIYSISPKDDLALKFTLSKFQYDTPDSVRNNDDRDELRIIGGLEYNRIFSPVLSLKLEAFVNLFHQVYIYKERSANNNWNRIFRLSSEIRYSNKNFSNKIKNEILANYSVYDFEQEFSQSQSFIFRKYILQDSLLTKLLPKLSIGFNGRYEIEDKGSFFKTQFAQQILQSTEAIYFDLFTRFNKIFFLDIENGVAIYSRNDWRHIPLKTVIRNVNTITPYIRIRYGFNSDLQFVCSASYVFSDEMDLGKSTYTNGSVSLIHYF